MKITRQQAELLAARVVEQLRSKKSVSKKEIGIVDTYFSELQTLRMEEERLREKRRKVELPMRKLGLPYIGSKEQAMTYLSIRGIPASSEVANEILLENIFDKEMDLKTFLAKMVAKYSKK